MNRRDMLKAAIAVAAIPAIPFKAPAAAQLIDGMARMEAAQAVRDHHYMVRLQLDDYTKLIHFQLGEQGIDIDFKLEPGTTIHKIEITESWARSDMTARIGKREKPMREQT